MLQRLVECNVPPEVKRYDTDVSYDTDFHVKPDSCLSVCLGYLFRLSCSS